MSFHFSFFVRYIRNHLLLSRVNLFIASSIVQTPTLPFSLTSSYLFWLLCRQYFCNYRSCQSFAGLEKSGSSSFLLQSSFHSPDHSCCSSMHPSWPNLGHQECTQHSRWGLTGLTFPRWDWTCSFWDFQTLAPAVFMAAFLWWLSDTSTLADLSTPNLVFCLSSPTDKLATKIPIVTLISVLFRILPFL